MNNRVQFGLYLSLKGALGLEKKFQHKLSLFVPWGRRRILIFLTKTLGRKSWWGQSVFHTPLNQSRSRNPHWVFFILAQKSRWYTVFSSDVIHWIKYLCHAVSAEPKRLGIWSGIKRENFSLKIYICKNQNNTIFLLQFKNLKEFIMWGTIVIRHILVYELRLSLDNLSPVRQTDTTEPLLLLK